MSSPVSSFQGRIVAEALLGGLAGDAELVSDCGPGVSLGPGPDDGGGEMALSPAEVGVGAQRRSVL
ncbi:MAG: hypothetical protein ACRDOK_12900 [Streptosporangiaceae bacterium]